MILCEICWYLHCLYFCYFKHQIKRTVDTYSYENNRSNIITFFYVMYLNCQEELASGGFCWTYPGFSPIYLRNAIVSIYHNNHLLTLKFELMRPYDHGYCANIFKRSAHQSPSPRHPLILLPLKISPHKILQGQTPASTVIPVIYLGFVIVARNYGLKRACYLVFTVYCNSKHQLCHLIVAK